MENPMFKLMKGPDCQSMCFNVWVKDQYRMIWPDAFFLMFWETEHIDRPMSVGPYLYANFEYDDDDICICFYDDDYGIVVKRMDLSIFQDLFRQTYDDIRKYDLNKLVLRHTERLSMNLFRFSGSFDALFNYMYLKRGRRDESRETPVSFDFQFVQPYDCDTRYMIKVGDSKFISYISDYYTDFNDIRLSIEKMITMYVETKELRLFNEDSPSVIRLERILPPWNLKELEEKVMVTILPDEFYEGPLLCGVCKKREVLSNLYLGLLRLCITQSSSYNEDGYEESSWDEFRLATYNKLQSCVIENYVQGIVEDECQSYPRQRWMSSVEEMEKDYAELCEKLK